MGPDILKVRRVPLRTCIGCRQTRLQKELIRICIRKSGELELDLEKSKPGRGVYICPRQECVDKGLKKEKLEHSLKARIAPEALKLFYQKGFPFVKRD